MTAGRLLRGTADGPLGLAAHTAVHGPLPADLGTGLIAEADRAGLHGRGGAGFPTAAKLEAVARHRGPRFVLVNAAEGEPMSAKDRTLLRTVPHLVLDGALAAAAAVRARDVVVAVAADRPAAIESVRRAVAERGADAVTVVPVPAAYLSGEESALIRHLGGGPLKPTVVPPWPSQRGLRHRPTLVHNPETLAHLALIARHGGAWFRQQGTAAQPGSCLITLTGSVRRPGVYETAFGTALSAVIEAAGGQTEVPRAVLVGGYHGSWVAAADVPALRLADEDLRRHGAQLAAGVIVILGRSACPVRELAAVLQWLALESAHQCGPCANGLPAIARLLHAMADARVGSDGLDLLHRYGGQLPGRGACRLPDGAVRFLTSGLRVFGAELLDHARRGPCPRCRRALTLRTPTSRAVAA
jgi:NADH:ubiquinone oxidoreductase subunit F (NADH-binding)